MFGIFGTMVIRKAQMDAMKPLAETGFHSRVVDYVKQNCAVAGLTEDALGQRITFAINRARGQKLITEQGITAFVALMFNLSPNFDDELQIQLILRNTKVPEPDRIRQLVLNVSAQTWRTVATARRDEIWHFKALSVS